MKHADHVDLLRDGVPGDGGLWADLGSGTGAFTLALAELIGPAGHIHSVDRDRGALRRQREVMGAMFPVVLVDYHHNDYTNSMALPPLDGIVMANALHFQRDKEPVLRHLRGLLRPGGRFILVEYDTDRGNFAVPHPLSYRTWESLAAACGFGATRLLRTVPSSFLGQFYSALSVTG